MDEPLEFFKVVFTEGNQDVIDQRTRLRRTIPLERVFEIGKDKPITVKDTETGQRIEKVMTITSIRFLKIFNAPMIEISAKPRGSDQAGQPLWYRGPEGAKLHVDADMLFGFTILELGDL